LAAPVNFGVKGGRSFLLFPSFVNFVFFVVRFSHFFTLVMLEETAKAELTKHPGQARLAGMRWS
jgi:hypothetical protein